jgi:hypothetical protein
MGDVISNYPIFGIGVSGFENLEKISSLNMPYMIAFGNNNIASLFIFLGLFGGLYFAYKFYYYINLYIDKRYLILFIIAIAIISTIMGGFQSPRFWGYVFIFFGVFRVLSKDVVKN